MGLSLGLIIEEGLSIETLRRIIGSIANTAREAGVEVVTGDTKVVERGQASEIFVNTSGVGLMRNDFDFSPDRIEADDVLIINGPIGDHGIAVMSVREGLSFTSAVKSDAAPLAGMVESVLDVCGGAIKCMKDPTRSGLAGALNEMARKVGIVLDEDKIPVRPEVRGACDMLGLEVMTVANEGKMIMAVSPGQAEKTLEVLHSHPFGSEAAVIGRADKRAGLVRMKTLIGGERIVDVPYGQELPRIC